MRRSPGSCACFARAEPGAHGAGVRRRRTDRHARLVRALAGAVRCLGLDPVDGHLYLFLDKRRRLAKALWFDGSGWCILAKRLEAGSFQIPLLPPDATQVQIDGVTFASLLAGIDFTASRTGWFRRLPGA